MNNSLDRFLVAQEHSYDTALREIRSGRKRSHWMWYIFPQIAGLGMSYTAQLYAIKDIEEARQYIAHPVLGARLIEISHPVFDAVLAKFYGGMADARTLELLSLT